ncbi:helix-turn-helix transcriptional regulator [Sporosarcina trichiuri]|uniref:helix-turn-helix transcriptional regulator n=1 Tax=Sporosarcina trichiuri TaxID=3056445 RepID=UPI0025B2B1F3|nr:helix-turn-helix transcriptional regulator [Sporosarcina sp. 0.2-SM1T-5]WJY26817.1 helix-turn-helix transcriptional regulator [Sporosarcina sp. 0.2-SM1T-5]
MEDRLRDLKKTMDRTLFRRTEFTDTHQEQIRSQLNAERLTETILPLLTKPKTGMELTQLLHARGVRLIAGHEGLVYSILHDAEQNGWLAASWADGQKYYQVTKLGTKAFFRERPREKQADGSLLREARADVQ